MERLRGIGIMRCEGLLERFEGGSLSHAEAVSVQGVSERTLRRWRQRYEAEGADGLVDRRVGAPSPRRAPEDALERMGALYQQDYQGFSIKPFHEKLAQRHGHKLGDTTTRLYLQTTGTVPPAPRRPSPQAAAPARGPARVLLTVTEHEPEAARRALAAQRRTSRAGLGGDARIRPRTALESGSLNS